MLLPITETNYKIQHVDDRGATPHSHKKTAEIIQVFEDEGNVLINGKLYAMQSNGLYYINGRAPHFVSPKDTTRYMHSIIHIDIDECEKLFKSLHLTDEYEKIFIKEGGSFCSLSREDVILADGIFLEIDKIAKGDLPVKYASLAIKLAELLMLGCKYSEKSLPHGDKKISEILSAVSSCALTDTGLDQICERAHISKYHLCRIFKENIGVTVGEFIKERRLSTAKQLLINSNMTVTEIATKCGYCDSSFFSKVFSKNVGMTPTEYRKTNK